MFIKKVMVLCGVVLLLASCSAGKYGNMGFNGFGQSDNTSDRGMRYLLGQGVEQNNEKAFYYFSKAANEGDPFAENELAYMYAAGKGTKRDYAQALRWYQRAAKHGLASAQYNLGLMYLMGLGTQPNKMLALKWFKTSATHGFEPARRALTRYAS